MFQHKSARLFAGAAALAFLATGCFEEEPAPQPDPEPEGSTYEALVRVDLEDTESEEPTIAASVPIPFRGTATVTNDEQGLTVVLGGSTDNVELVEFPLFPGAALELTYDVIDGATLAGSLEDGVAGQIVIDVTNVDVYSEGSYLTSIELVECPMTMTIDADVTETADGLNINQEGFIAEVTEDEDLCASQGELIQEVLGSPLNEINIDVKL